MLRAGALKQSCDQIVNGNGFKKSIDVLDAFRDTSGATLTNSTTPAITALESSALGIVVANNATLIGKLIWQVPRDYDQTNDYLRLRFLASSSGDNNTPAIDATVYRIRTGAAISSDLDPTISGSINNDTTDKGWVEINIDGKSLQPGDVLTITVDTAAHATDNVDVYGAELVYKTDLVYNVRNER